jgi:hypothetical protein
MIEANEPTNGQVVKQETPTRITTTMILEDLENGISRDGIKEKYGLETWEVTQMFQHPTLKGKKAKKIRKLSFEFVDDTENVDPNQTDLETAIEEVELEETFESFEDTEEAVTETNN